MLIVFVSFFHKETVTKIQKKIQKLKFNLQLPNVTLLGLDCVELERFKLARDICVKDIEFGAVKLLTSIPSDDKDVVKVDHVGSLSEYSAFMIKKLNDYVDTDFVLIFQWDGIVLGANNWRDEFLDYDYIGAPWIGYANYESGHKVGNGGFSLRSKKLLEILANDPKIELKKPCGAEDGIICYGYRNYLETKGIKYAPEEIAGKFAIADIMKVECEKWPGIAEKQYREYLAKCGVVLDSKEKELKYQIPEAYEKGDLKWTNEFGCHYLTPWHVGRWLELHPEYKGKIKPKEL